MKFLFFFSSKIILFDIFISGINSMILRLQDSIGRTYRINKHIYYFIPSK